MWLLKELFQVFQVLFKNWKYKPSLCRRSCQTDSDQLSQNSFSISWYLHTAVCSVLTFPVIVASGERSSSNLNLIIKYLRTMKSQIIRTAVSQTISVLHQHKLSKKCNITDNYNVTNYVKTTVSISVRTIVSNSQNHTVTSSLRIPMSWTMRNTMSHCI